MAAIEATFVRMASEFPVRTALFSFGPLVLAVLQLVNGHLHGIPIPYVGGFAALLIAFAVLITRYHLVTFRLTKLLEGRRDRP